MKKFATYLLFVAICGVLLAACIKEEEYLVETAELSVNLTRAGTSSTVQGDAITDAWIWGMIILWFIAGMIMGALGILAWGGWLCGKEHDDGSDERSADDP